MPDSTKPTLSESDADLERGVPPERFVRGQWQVGLFDCGHHCIPNGWMACFCPCVSLAQISARFEPDSFRSVLIKQLVLHLLYVGVIVAYVVSYIDIKKNFSQKDDPTTQYPTAYGRTSNGHSTADRTIAVIKLVSCFIVTLIVGWFIGRAIGKLRTRVRERFRIPGSEKDDSKQASWCSTCAIAQMATQVKSYKPGSCSFSKPDELPAFIY